MTSRYTREHSIGYLNGDSRLQGMTTLADVFKAKGYRTAAFVGNVILYHTSGFNQGFDVYDDLLPDAELNRKFVFERIAEQTTERALEWLKGRDDRPFFLWVHYQDPHGPYTPPPGFKGRFQPEFRPGEKPLTVLESWPGINGIPPYQVLDDFRRPSFYETRYAEEIAYADHWIGELVAQVEAASSSAGTLIALTSDHGESLGEDGRYFAHGNTTTPDQAHVPLILKAPGLAAGRRAETVHHVDIMPTLLELAGIEAPDAMSGVALGPVLRGDTKLAQRLVYCDEGVDLSAYGSEGFVRVGGILAAWHAGEVDHPAKMAPLWADYIWTGGATWREVNSVDAISKDEIRNYFREAVPMAVAEDPSESRAEMLRALGYGQ
jgi:arylsulfatase A-like enzyme